MLGSHIKEFEFAGVKQPVREALQPLNSLMFFTV